MIDAHDISADIRADEAVLRAAGSIDEVRFVDVLVRNADPLNRYAVPAGSRLVLRGWVILQDTSSLPTRVFANVGTRSYELVCGRSRPDIGAAFGKPELSGAGFQGVISLEGLTSGTQQVQISAIDDEGAVAILESSVEFELLPSRIAFPTHHLAAADEMTLVVDEVTAFTGRSRLDNGRITIESGDVLVVRGWAVDVAAQRGLGGIFAVIDGREYVMGVHGLPREDIGRVYEDFALEARRSGYIVRISTRHLALGSHSLSIRALTADEERYQSLDAGAFEVASHAVR